MCDLHIKKISYIYFSGNTLLATLNYFPLLTLMDTPHGKT